MDNNKVRAVISIIVILGFMIVTGIIAIYVYANDLQGVTDTSKTISALKDYSSLFTGIIGAIIGFYFGQSKNETSKSDKP